jgi:hypothetical protein
MRVVQLDIGGHRVEFHPYVTVVRGLDDELRQDIVRVVGALTAGEAAAGGLVEAHGVFLDLSDDALELLDLPRPGFDLDLVVNATQVPGALEPGVLARNDLDRRRETLAARLARAEANAERARLALATSREALEAVANGSSGEERNQGATLDSLRREAAELVAAREAAEARLEAAKTAYEQVERTLSAEHDRLGRVRQHRAHASRVAGEAAQALEATRAASDPFAAAAFDAARERLRLLQAPDAANGDAKIRETGDLSADTESTTPMSADDAAAEVSRLELRHAELEAALLALDTVDPFAVETALEQVRSNDDIELVPSPEAQRIADEWVRNEAALAGETSFEETSGNVLATARRRLDAARAEVFEAERAVRIPEIDRHDVEALENAHEEVLLAQDRADKRFGGERARQRLHEARVAEQAILDRIGFDTYASFMMGTSIQHVDTEREHKLEASRVELAAAEDALGVLEKGIDAELALAALLARRRDLRDEAARVLGRDPGEDFEWELRHHRVEVRGGGERARRLRSALESAGMMLGSEQPPKRMLVDLAEIWLEEQRQTGEHRTAIGHDLAAVEAELDVARKGLWRARNDEADDGDRLEREIEHARDALEGAEERVRRQSEIEADVSQRRSNLTRALDAEREAAAQLSSAEEDEAEAARAEHESATDLARLHAELAAALAAERGTAEELDDLTRIVDAMGDPQNQSQLQAAVAESEAAVATAAAAAAAARSELSEIDGLLEQATSGNGDASVATSAAAVEELEWYLLSRLAQLRALSYAGSLPCVLDDALRGVEGDGLIHLLGRLERMSSAVQIIILSDDTEIAAWADGIGSDRAVTLYPLPL